MVRKLIFLVLFAAVANATSIRTVGDPHGNVAAVSDSSLHVIPSDGTTQVGIDADSAALQVRDMYQTRYIIGPNGDTTDVTVVGENVALNVDIQDRETELIDLHFYTNGTTRSFFSTVTAGSRSATIATGSGISVGDYIIVSEGTRFYDGIVLTKAITPPEDDFTFDTPFDFAFTTAAVIAPGLENLNQDGSVTPIIAFVSPQNLQDGVGFHITRIMISITDETAMDDGIFGGGAALTNGIVVRTIRDGEFHNLFNAKTNGDLAAHAYDLTYASKPPAGSGHGLRWRRTFGGQSKGGSVVALSSTTNDQIQIVIQDNLTGLVTFTAVAQGHVEE